MTTFLLSLLSNVQEVNFGMKWTRSWQSDPETDALLNVICRNAGTGPFEALAHVDTLKTSGETGYDERAGLEDLNPFLVLPGLRKLRGINLVALDDGYTGIPFKWRHPGLTCNLEEIEITHSCVAGNGNDLAELFRHTPKLRSFKLVYAVKWHGAG